MEKKSFWQELREFRMQLSKVVIPFEIFFQKANENSVNNSTHILERISFGIEI
ncbi:MAG: hypothetical protein ACFFFB_19400 [Candidatus Heimdallarchaeota archaeon]